MTNRSTSVRVLSIAAAVGAVLSVIGSGMAAAAPPEGSTGPTAGPTDAKHIKLHLIDGTQKIQSRKSARSAPAALTSTVASYSTTNIDANTGKSYPARFVGGSPSANATTTITVNLVPMNFVLQNANGTSTTINASAAATATAGSPMFTNTATKPAGEVTQYLDAYVRANAGKVGSNYHLLLNPVVKAPVTVTVPYGQWSTVGSEYGVLDTTIQNAVTTNGISGAYSATGLTMFVAPNVYGDDGTFQGSGFGGYHDQRGNYTFGYANIEANNTNLQAFSHEVAEWAMDPFVGGTQYNVVPGSSVAGYGCLTNLEVGDPVYTSTYTQVVGSTTWKLEDEVYVPWFFHTSPSPSYQGKYSMLGLTSPATSC
ncbi:hypothetical protein [Williamsia sp. CHRR-6]|uniref:hypothetical protein n=1 Tax=Williamsia sp. CHRR-6 TaxID=2835871 RepID=UPI001BDA38EA|nr:hypothetical protein [Williamsia sp. CHRR-6]MBT0566487.1 hypothetical protein [Williamsia sp. CHRR-6]